MATLDGHPASDHSDIDLKMEKGNMHVEAAPLKLDKRGLPLVPQPSDHKDDPLNWPV
jgi:hypothetical protein